jgi:hypothetical protein
VLWGRPRKRDKGRNANAARDVIKFNFGGEHKNKTRKQVSACLLFFVYKNVSLAANESFNASFGGNSFPHRRRRLLRHYLLVFLFKVIRRFQFQI